MSHQSQLELNDIPDFANEPGPGHYFGPGSVGFGAIGKQCHGKNASAPDISFPKTGWGKWQKVIISKGHQGTDFCKETLALKNKYVLPDGLGTKATKIGTSLRPDVSMMMGADPKGSPGPNINLRDAPGADPFSEPSPGKKDRQPKTFGGADRFDDRTKPGGIGPGEYPRKDTSIKVGGGRSIGTGRGAYDKVCTPGWEEYGKCRANELGPGDKDHYDIHKHGSGAFSIGKASRFPGEKKVRGPGPGTYKTQNQKGVSAEKQALSDSRSPGAVSFGNEPKLPRFRVIHAANLDGAKHGQWGYH
jgi:hypothetical protein